MAGAQPANRGRDLAYPGESFAAQQRRGYPDLATLDRVATPQETFADALAAADRLGWVIVAGDPARLRFEAYEETSFFHFVDDVVVRVRPDSSGGSLVDVRSKSRDGQGDIGANAARIRAFFVHPAWARHGLGRLLYQACAAAALAAGFRELELMATLPGEPLYTALGFTVRERFVLSLPDGVQLPLTRMSRLVESGPTASQPTLLH